ncbi:sporulation protein [Streptomyces bikiniensis]|uniref:sporulation protein n=1 Tax=Streptomyces bikiniensis TaxID=1896 RepID=UPI0004BEF1C3|nr:sporulation protein [Streptomyces bikiniensis]
MGLRRLFGRGGDEDGRGAAEVDTRITSPVCMPGRPVDAEVVIRGGARGLAIDELALEVVVQALHWDGSPSEESVCDLSTSSWAERVAAGSEKRLAFRGRLPWETPVTEIGGQAVGAVVSVVTKLSWDSEAPVADTDLLHVTAPPLYEAVLGAFAEEGYRVDGSQVRDSYIPDAESQSGRYQSLFLTAPTRGADRFAELEVVLHQNAVGAVVYVRRADRSTFEWEDKPPARTFAAAHHEAGHADFGPRVRDALRKLALLDG